MQYLCKKNIEMDKIIGMGNALVDVLATLNDDHILTEMELPKGSMTLIDETKLLIINECFSEMETELATGGSAGNAIRGMACLGAGTGFIGKVGNDFFGDQLRAAIKEAGIDDIGLCTDEKIHTTLAMVHTYPDGDRDFSFYRNPGADMMLNKAEICEDRHGRQRRSRGRIRRGYHSYPDCIPRWGSDCFRRQSWLAGSRRGMAEGKGSPLT